MRKRTLLGKGASLNNCSSTLVTRAVYSSSSSATIATCIISSISYSSCFVAAQAVEIGRLFILYALRWNQSNTIIFIKPLLSLAAFRLLVSCNHNLSRRRLP
ncbi:hypothetical protein Nepgr_024662 [Nepenthes gracilis]|uniref:Uncharacterized protein n=1 Tax=Nepenthes gracilis TaxID=150966 RepID=A0AAD3T5L1_NEPGR|nr:hypothetical protein Nepgr_024662 [Nepenthes gracilis]